MSVKPSNRTCRVAMLLPNSMAVRNTLETPVLSELSAYKDLEIRFLTSSPDHAEKIISVGKGRFKWSDMGNPMQRQLTLGFGPKGLALRRILERALLKPFRRWMGWGNLVHRFNERQGFTGHRFKKNLPAERRERENLAGNYPDPRFGKPFPRSRFWYEAIYKLYHSTWYSEPHVEAFLDEFSPDLLVIHHLQNPSIRPWISGARRRKIPLLGIVGSWDQPTTKGPMPPGLQSIIVQSRAMKQELVRYHQMQSNKVHVTGWPQMDFYCDPKVMVSKQEFAKGLGIDPQHQIILFGANSERLGAHELGIANHIAKNLKQGMYGSNISLLIRPHPKDDEYWQRFGPLNNPPLTVVLPCETGRLDFLANLLKHASVVLASTGTFLLDAIALDACAVNIAFDGDLEVAYQNSIARWKELDHYAPVISSGAMQTATSYEQLDESIKQYLDDPAKDAGGRARCRAEQLEPFDGTSSKRLADLIHQSAMDSSNA